MASIVRTLLLLFVVALGVVLGLQNNESLSQPFSVRFIAWASRPLPVWLVLLIAFATGILVGSVSLLVDYARLRRQLSRERSRADEATRRADEQARRADEAERRVDEAAPVAELPASRSPLPGEDLEDELEFLDDDDDPDSTSLAPRPGRTRGGAE